MQFQLIPDIRSGNFIIEKEMFGLFTDAISCRGSFSTDIIFCFTSGVAVAVRAMMGTRGNCTCKFTRNSYLGL